MVKSSKLNDKRRPDKRRRFGGFESWGVNQSDFPGVRTASSLLGGYHKIRQ
jgi:hypothetical protein